MYMVYLCTYMYGDFWQEYSCLARQGADKVTSHP